MQHEHAWRRSRLACALVATAAAFAGFAGTAVAADPPEQPTCPSSISGTGSYTLVGSKVFDETGGSGLVFSLECDYGPSAHPSYGGGSVRIYWAVRGYHTRTDGDPGIDGCGRASFKSHSVSDQYWAYAESTGNIANGYNVADPTAGKNGQDALVAQASSFAEPCQAADARPTVQAITSSGHAPRIKLHFRVADDNGAARVVIVIRNAAGRNLRVLGPTRFLNVSKTTRWWLRWNVPRGWHGAYEFCVQAEDRAGNKSVIDCAPLNIYR